VTFTFVNQSGIFHDVGLTPSTKYKYQVSAGGSLSNIAYGTTFSADNSKIIFFLQFEKSLTQCDKCEILDEIKKLRHRLRAVENEANIRIANKEQEEKEKANAK